MSEYEYDEEYEYEDLKFFNIQKSEAPTGHLFMPSVGEVFVHPFTTEACVMLFLDLGAIDASLQGVRVPFVEVPPVVSVIDFQRQPDGRYHFITSDVSKSLEEFFTVVDRELEDSFRLLSADDITPKYELTEGASVQFEAIPDEADWGKPLGWSPGEGVYWCQASSRADYGVDGDAWVYAGCVSSEYFFGMVYVFYHREDGLVRQIFECT